MIRSFAPLTASLLLALGCAACANGYSPSYATGPLLFSDNAEGDLVVALADGGGDGAADLVGDFNQGVQGYDVVGGNALLPTRRPVQQAALIAPLGGLVTAATAPGAAQVSVADGLVRADAGLLSNGQPAPSVGLNVGDGLVTASVAGAGAGGAPQLSVGAGAGQGLAGVGVTSAASAAGAVVGGVISTPGTTFSAVTSALPPDVTVTRTLTTQGPLLGAPATITAVNATANSLSGGAVNSVIDALRRKP